MHPHLLFYLFLFLFFVFLDDFAIQFGDDALLLWKIFQCMKRTWSATPPPPPTLAPCTTSPLPPPPSASFDLFCFVVVVSSDVDFSLSF